jgi:peptide/nickel transport system substrate-binding protein
MKTRGLNRREMLAASALFGAAALGAPRFAVSQDGRVLRVRSYSDIQNLDPCFRPAAPDDDVMRNIFVGLVTTKSGDEWGWELDGAASVTQVSDTQIDFTLREGLTWTGDYGAVTAEDVKYSFERFADPALESPYAGDWSALDRVEVKDALSGSIFLKEPFVPLWPTTLSFGSGLIMCKAAMEKAGGRFTTEPPAQCGRYLLAEWSPKQRTVLRRNPDWTGAPPHFDEVHVIPIEDEKTAELGFEAGELDYTWVSQSSIPRYRETPPKGGALMVKPSLAYVWLGVVQTTPPFDRLEVRRAVQHAIDVPLVLEAAYFGAAEPSTGIIAPGLIGHREKTLFSYDPDKARALLAEAGLGGGFECKLSLLNKTEYVNAAQAIQALLADVGIAVVIDQHDSGTFWTLGDEKSGDSWKTLQLLLGRFSMQPDPSWATEWFTPEQVGVWNWERFDSPEFGELHRKARVELDPQKRQAMYVRMQDLMEESGSYVFLTHGSTGLVHREGVSPALMPHGAPIFHGFAAT